MGKAENEIETYLRKEITRHGGLCWKISAAHTKGIPDRIVVLNRTVFVEVKAPGKKLQEMQKFRRQEIFRAGGEHLIIDTKDKVDALVQTLLKQPKERTLTYESNPDQTQNNSFLQKPMPTLHLGKTSS